MKYSLSRTCTKHATRVGITVLLLAGLCLSQSGSSSFPSDWTQFHRDNMQRWNPYETVLNVNNVRSLQPRWRYTTGYEVHSSPAVSSGVVYIGSDDHNVYALSAATGAKLWRYATGSVVNSSPAVVNGVVYVGSYDRRVYALNAATGDLLWSYLTGGWVDTSSPAVANGLVYVGSLDNKVHALNASTGVRVWSYLTAGRVTSSPRCRMGWCMSAPTTTTCTR